MTVDRRGASVPCIILAGGLGTRLRSVLPDLPKCLAPVNGRPFLAWQIDSLVVRGVDRFVMSLGNRADQVERVAHALRRPGLEIECVVELAPLGTGGAVLHALRSLALEEALVVNGDTFLEGAIDAMQAPLDRAGGELVRMATVRVDDRSRYGCVVSDAHNRVIEFLEKGHGGAGLINAGFYRVHLDAFDHHSPQDSFSFESLTLPSLARQRAVTSVQLDAMFIDIGMPSDYLRFCEDRVAG